MGCRERRVSNELQVLEGLSRVNGLVGGSGRSRATRLLGDREVGNSDLLEGAERGFEDPTLATRPVAAREIEEGEGVWLYPCRILERRPLPSPWLRCTTTGTVNENVMGEPANNSEAVTAVIPHALNAYRE